MSHPSVPLELRELQTTLVLPLWGRAREAQKKDPIIFDTYAKEIAEKRTGIHSSSLVKWHLKRAPRLRRWVKTIKVVEEYPAYSKTEIRQDWGEKMIRQMKQADRLRMYNMIHVQFQ